MKRDDTWRTRTNYQALNALTVKDWFPPPLRRSCLMSWAWCDFSPSTISLPVSIRLGCSLRICIKCFFIPMMFILNIESCLLDSVLPQLLFKPPWMRFPGLCFTGTWSFSLMTYSFIVLQGSYIGNIWPKCSLLWPNTSSILASKMFFWRDSGGLLVSWCESRHWSCLGPIHRWLVYA